MPLDRSVIPAVQAGPAHAGARPLPTYTVVMPNYNHARYIEAALGAHLAQVEPALEILVVDDASTDESCAVVEHLAAQHPRLRLIRLARNAGVNAAMNRGLREARGDYVCFSAADDLVTPEFSVESLRALAPYPDAAFCFSDAAILIGDTGVVRHSPLFLSDGPCRLSAAHMRRFLERTCYHLPSHSIVYRRDLLLAIGGFVEDLRWIADWFMNYVLAFRHGACYVPRVLTFFRVSSTSYSAVGSREDPAQRQLLDRMLELLGSEAYRDVAKPFRRAAVIFDLRARVLAWLLTSPRNRWYVTPRLAARLCVRGLCALASAWVPMPIRRLAGRFAVLARKRRLGGLRRAIGGRTVRRSEA